MNFADGHFFFVGLVIIDDPWCELEFDQLFYI